MRCYGDSVQYHVFEMSRPLPRFSMYSLLDGDHGIAEPQSHVTFHVKERVNRVSSSFLCSSAVKLVLRGCGSRSLPVAKMYELRYIAKSLLCT